MVHVRYYMYICQFNGGFLLNEMENKYGHMNMLFGTNQTAVEKRYKRKKWEIYIAYDIGSRVDNSTQELFERMVLFQ